MKNRSDQNEVCWVRLRNAEIWILSKDGWNPGQEIRAYGPMNVESDSEVWTLDTDEIIAYRSVRDEELENWKNYGSPLLGFIQRYDHRLGGGYGNA